jgi:putative transposase
MHWLSVLVASVSSVKQVVKVRMLPTDSEAAALDATLSGAASWLAAAMHEQRVHRKYDAHKRFYTELKARFGLSAQPAIRVIGKVAEAYASLRANLAAGICGPPGSPRRTKVAAKPIAFSPDAVSNAGAKSCAHAAPTLTAS